MGPAPRQGIEGRKTPLDQAVPPSGCPLARAGRTPMARQSSRSTPPLRKPGTLRHHPAILTTIAWRVMLGHNRKKMLGAECLADMLKGYGVTHDFHVAAVLRRSFAEMGRRTDIKRLHVHGESPPPTWPTAMRAPPASPASAWRR